MQSTPNVTPMIDVMLVLLIIFMVVTPQLLAGFTAEPPRAVNLKDHPEDAENDHVLGIDAGGRYYLDKKLYDEKDLGTLLKEIYTAPGREDFVIYLRAHREVSYEKVQNAMDIAMKNGVRVMGLIGEQEPGTASTVAGDSKTPPPGGK
ncbi:MAG TPA: biopolymer transporter ExbD [Gemmatimonadaceae bacterium]|nr:biopolymer transporter ExbD [Gemmatimonadaceae bacterium]